MNIDNKAAVFILFGQSNAVGHGIPMEEKDKILVPMKNVLGLTRRENQRLYNKTLYWQGYTSYEMNLAETQDNTYSVANCLARLWQDSIDAGKKLPDLYIVHIAIGAQGVTKKYMWNPCYPERLVPGVLGKVDISLYSFAFRILEKIEESLKALGKTEICYSLHWRGGEEDAVEQNEILSANLKNIYSEMFDGFCKAIGRKIPIVLHRIAAHERYTDLDPSGRELENMHLINGVFDELADQNENISVFDVTKSPQYIPGVRCNGIFLEDAVHFTPDVNRWVAGCVLEEFTKNIRENN